jgi:hypothetical protein
MRGRPGAIRVRLRYDRDTTEYVYRF